MSSESRPLSVVLAILGDTIRLGELRATQVMGGRNAGLSDLFALARR